MFYQEIYEQTEPGGLFSEYLEAQTLKISPLSTNHGGAFLSSMCILVCLNKVWIRQWKHNKKLSYPKQNPYGVNLKICRFSTKNDSRRTVERQPPIIAFPKLFSQLWQNCPLHTQRDQWFHENFTSYQNILLSSQNNLLISNYFWKQWRGSEKSCLKIKK